MSLGGDGPDRAVPFVDRLHLVVLPTESCNLRCHYCYEDFQIGRMSEATVASLLGWLRGWAPHLSQIYLDWFGGEPLLAVDTIERVQEELCALERSLPDLRTAGAMTTNATRLSPSRLERLVGLGITTYQVTLDGDETEHDRRRVGPRGQGTFSRIWTHLLAARDTDLPFRFCLRLHVDRLSAPGYPGFLQKLADEFAGDNRFSLLIRGIARLGGLNDSTLPILGQDEQTVVRRLRELALGLGLEVVESEPATPCYAGLSNSYVVRANGDLAKCTVALSDPRNRVGRLGENGVPEIDATSLAPWIRGRFEPNAVDHSCPLNTLEAV